MSKKCDTITGILQRKGTDQLLRNKYELDPASIELMDFDVEDWMKFAYNFAKHVNYFAEENSKIPEGDWQGFFKNNEDLKELLENLDKSQSLTPHLTLFICFLRLLDFSKARLNKITKRHLDFFYTEILKIDKIPAQSDNAYVVFELAKSFSQVKLEKGLGLDGGKDADGKKRIYELTEELAANKAKVAQLKNLYYHQKVSDKEGPDAGNYMRSSKVANSLDGQGEAFVGEDVSWLPFAYYQNEKPEKNEPLDKPVLEKAKIGFSIASDILQLSEGERHVQFSIDFKSAFTQDNAPSFDDLKDSIQVYYTIKNKWEGPLPLESNAPAEESVPEDVSLQSVRSLNDFDTYVSNKRAELYVKLERKNEATAAYNSEIHLGNLGCESPVFRFIIDVNTAAGIKVFNAFSKEITGIAIQVNVEGMRQLILDSDTGKLNPTKPMYPFTTLPVKGSNLVIDQKEIFQKNWSSIDVQIKWQNTPSDFVTWYEAYQSTFIGQLSPKTYSDSQTRDIAAKNQARLPLGKLPIVTDTSYFSALKYIKSDNEWLNAGEGDDQLVELFQEIATDEEDSEDKIEIVNNFCNFEIFNDSKVPTEPYGPIKLSLKNSFMHDLYPQLYALALSSTNSSTLIPNKPYTPFAEEIVVNYSAKEFITFSGNDENAFENRNITLLHESPFGQILEHDYLRTKYNAQLKDCTLVPKVNKGGELYIGLKDAVNLQTVSLFVQLLEGSENPEAQSFDSTNVTWEVLCSDFWQPLDTVAIKMNEIDNFLNSGLVRIEIPKEATDDNRQLDKGLIWIKAIMPLSYDAVCRVLSISTQGAMARFVNNDNELSHLEKGLPAETISKLQERLSTVKSVLQPYNTFDGKPEESDPAYYKRVSERLRHKNRAIMLWDYESIILQEFPDIYRVKCLNHTNSKSFLAAGCVTVVVVPDTVNKNMFNILQPRVSKAYLNKIKRYVSQLTSLHVNLDIINPEYEDVEIAVKVKFHDQYDAALYQLELNEDLKKYLSPWAFDEAKNVEFGVTLHRTVVIDFIERLHYVDYVLSLDLKLVNPDNKSKLTVRNATPSSPRAILVSVEQHDISTVEVSGTSVTTIEAEC